MSARYTVRVYAPDGGGYESTHTSSRAALSAAHHAAQVGHIGGGARVYAGSECVRHWRRESRPGNRSAVVSVTPDVGARGAR